MLITTALLSNFDVSAIKENYKKLADTSFFLLLLTPHVSLSVVWEEMSKEKPTDWAKLS